MGNYNITLEDNASSLYTRLHSEKVLVLNHQGAETDHTYNYGTSEHDYNFPDSPGNQANVYYNIIRAWNRFDDIFEHNQPFITADANNNEIDGWGNTNGSIVRYRPQIGRYSWTIQHEFTHCVVYNINGNSWINPAGWCMDEAFPTYFPCVFNGTSIYTTPDASRDLSTNTGDMTINDRNSDGIIDEDDHIAYLSRYAVAAAWWELRSSLGEATLHSLMWTALENLQPPNSHGHPRDYFNELLVADDDDNNRANGTPNLNTINSAYKNHGMNYWPDVFSCNILGNGIDNFFIGDKIYCKGSGFPTNQQVRIYIVNHSDSWTNNATLSDVSGGFETVTADGDGDLPTTELWEPSDVDLGVYDIIVDVDQDGTFDFDFDGIIDASDDINEIGFTVSSSIATMDFEDGTDGAVISSNIPGMFFTTTAGYDWVYGDIRTGNYNVYPYGSGAYYCHGNFFAWLGPNQGYGRIDFTGATAKSISARTSSYSTLYIEAYDANGQLIDSDSEPGNLYNHSMGQFTVTGTDIAYILIHDAGNYWCIDDLVVVDLLRETAAQLPEGFATILELLHTINPGAVENFLVQVTEMSQQLQIILNWPGSEFHIAVYDPDGNLYGEWQSSNPPIIIDIPYAEPGEWEIIVTAIDIPENDYPYALVVGGAVIPPVDLYALFVPDTWYSSWAADPRGTIRTTFYDFPDDYTNTDINPSTVLLNDAVPLAGNRIIPRPFFPGVDGPIALGAFMRQASVLSLDDSPQPGVHTCTITGAFTDGQVFNVESDITLINGMPKETDPEPLIPDTYTISQNYPNPFNAQTIIEYGLPEPAHITLDIYDILGRKVATLVNTEQSAGYHQAVWNANDVTSGVYFYCIHAGKFTETTKMILLK